MKGELLIAQGQDFPGGAAHGCARRAGFQRAALSVFLRAALRLSLRFHESAAGQDVTHPSISPRAMWHIDKSRIQGGVALASDETTAR